MAKVGSGFDPIDGQAYSAQSLQVAQEVATAGASKLGSVNRARAMTDGETLMAMIVFGFHRRPD